MCLAEFGALYFLLLDYILQIAIIQNHQFIML